MEKALENKEDIDQLIKSAQAYIKNTTVCKNAESPKRDEESFAEVRNCETPSPLFMLRIFLSACGPRHAIL